MGLALEELGFTAEELRERVIEQCVERVLSGRDYEEDGEYCTGRDSIFAAMRKIVTERIDQAVKDIGDRHILPTLIEHIEAQVIQQTNAYGEKKGEPMTFVEYLIHRAAEYMQEPVDYFGKTKGGYDWKPYGHRLVAAIDRHLAMHIETAMKQVILEGDKMLSDALIETTKTQLENIRNSLKVNVTAGR